jgi:hypothetical protein
MGLEASTTSLFTLAANTFLAKPSLMDFAMSIAEIPCWYSLTVPSGNVILIMFGYLQAKFRVANLTNP